MAHPIFAKLQDILTWRAERQLYCREWGSEMKRRKIQYISMQGGKVSEGNLKYFKLLNKKNGNDFYGQKNVQV